MKRLTTLLMALALMSTMLWAEETITVSANSSDISEGLDLKVVAKLFAEAKNLEQFETMLNNPDSAFCNLDLNGDGQVDYLRVVEKGEGNKRLVVLQAILAKDIYQDVATIYVEKDETTNNVSVQIIGDEYVYGTNYIIEPVYVYRPVIYDWFWSSVWYAWYSPWYWGHYPGWWYTHACWAHDRYWHHCYAFHHHHHHCSFRPGRAPRQGYHELRPGVTRRDYAAAHPDRSFERRHQGMTNAREIRNTTGVRTRQDFIGGNHRVAAGRNGAGVTERAANTNFNRTYGSRNVVTERRSADFSRGDRTTGVTERRSADFSRGDRSTGVTQRRSADHRSDATTQRISVDRTNGVNQRTNVSNQRTGGLHQTTNDQRQTTNVSTNRNTYSNSSSVRTNSYSGSSNHSGSSSRISAGSSNHSGSSVRSSGYSGGSSSRMSAGSSNYSGSSVRSSGYSGGSSSRMSAGSSNYSGSSVRSSGYSGGSSSRMSAGSSNYSGSSVRSSGYSGGGSSRMSAGGGGYSGGGSSRMSAGGGGYSGGGSSRMSAGGGSSRGGGGGATRR